MTKPSGHFGGRRPARQDRTPRFRNAARARFRARLRPQIDERSEQLRALGAESRGRLSRRPIGAARCERYVRDLFRLSGAGRPDGRHRSDGARGARSRHIPPGQSGDAAILAGRADAADAAELFVRAGVRMGRYRRGAYPGTVFYENLARWCARACRRKEPSGCPGARRPPCCRWSRRRRRARRGRPLDRPPPMAGTHPLIGTTISLQEIIATFGRVFGKNVHYEEISDEQWRRDAASRGFNAHAIEHLSALWRASAALRSTRTIRAMR